MAEKKTNGKYDGINSLDNFIRAEDVTDIVYSSDDILNVPLIILGWEELTGQHSVYPQVSAHDTRKEKDIKITGGGNGILEILRSMTPDMFPVRAKYVKVGKTTVLRGW